MTPCFPEDVLDGSLGRGYRAHAYTRAGIAAEAGVEAASLRKAASEGRLDDSTPYSAIAYIARRRRADLAARGVDVEAGLAMLDELGKLSRERVGDWLDDPADDEVGP